MKLKYGMNPHQQYAELADDSNLTVLNGLPSYINLLDALNAWQLVREMDRTTNQPAATSFKHVTPSGSAISTNFHRSELLSYNIRTEPTSPLARAYAKARGTDRLASFGDFVAMSRTVDVETANHLKREVSDGIIAPEFEPEALEILQSKKGGQFIVFRINRDYEPPSVEGRTVFGFTIRQNRNDITIDERNLSNRLTENRDVTPEIARNLLIGMVTLKYTQSNSIAVVVNGHAIGIGSGQQSRILCTELALTKANKWYQRTCLDYSKIPFPEHLRLTRTQKDLLIEEERKRIFDSTRTLGKLDDVCLCSDGFFPQTDNIELANMYGVKCIASPMGSVRDKDVIDLCNQFGMIFINTGLRLFHH